MMAETSTHPLQCTTHRLLGGPGVGVGDASLAERGGKGHAEGGVKHRRPAPRIPTSPLCEKGTPSPFTSHLATVYGCCKRAPLTRGPPNDGGGVVFRSTIFRLRARERERETERETHKEPIEHHLARVLKPMNSGRPSHASAPGVSVGRLSAQAGVSSATSL